MNAVPEMGGTRKLLESLQLTENDVQNQILNQHGNHQSCDLPSLQWVHLMVPGQGNIYFALGEAIPLEYNLAGLNAISFEKGCYVGQELVARTHHRGVIRSEYYQSTSHLIVEKVQQKVAPKSELINADSGKAVGTVTTVLGSRGLALLRLEAALKNSNRLNLKGLESIKVEVVRPKWWPREWGQEEKQRAAVA